MPGGLDRPVEILGVVLVSHPPVETDASVLLVSAVGGALVLKLTPDVATEIYKAVCENRGVAELAAKKE